MDDTDDNVGTDQFEVLDVTTSDDDYGPIRRFITKLPMVPDRPSAQIAVGTTSGWVIGYLSKKIGKVAATAIGGGFLMLQAAQQSGYLTIDWRKLDQDIKRARLIVDSDPNVHHERILSFAEKAQRVVKHNAMITASFVAGFFLGLAS